MHGVISVHAQAIMLSNLRYTAAVTDQAKPKPKPSRPSPPPRVEQKKPPGKSLSSHNVLSRILKKKSPLVRAKSLEDILSSSQSKDDYAEISREGSPSLEHEPETFKPTPPPLPPPRVPGAKRQSSIETPESPKVVMLPKPKPAYYRTANVQKPLMNGHAQSGSRRSESPPSSRSPTSPSEQQSSLDSGAVREQLLSKMIERMQRRYIAVHSYTAPNEGCLSFSAGDMCTVKQKKGDGWWLVRVGEKEGWTPGNYWKEENRVSNALPVITHQRSELQPVGVADHYHIPCHLPYRPLTIRCQSFWV